VANDNTITIIGNLTDDPELRYTPAGVPVANCRVAVNRRIYNRETQGFDDRLDGYFTVNVWRGYAENAAESLRRGTRVIVMGRLISRSYEDKEGQTRWVTEIEADEICPSLRWATAKVTKVNRSDSGGSRGGDGGFGGPPPPSGPPDTDDVPF
jgi:single-strand DNA-binding protein